MSKPPAPVKRHFTTRRGFAVLVGLSILTLYVLWAAYGAAPTSLRFLAEADGGTMGHGGAGGITPQQFAELTEKFVEEFSREDGSVKPMRRRGPDAPMQGGMGHAKEGEHDDGDEHGTMKGMASRPAGAGAAKPGEAEEGRHDEGAEPIDVYLMAMRFSYTPGVLRLEAGVPYRFRVMSMDVNHGASIHTGFAGHIMRRPVGKVVEMIMTFTEPGEYMIYCTVFCGDGHDLMKGKIIVE